MTSCEGKQVEDSHRRRKDCRRCTRPERVCLCTALPASPVRLRGAILILQHPHELKKRLATVPILRCCLDAESLYVVTGRKLQSPGANPLTDSLLEGAQRGEYPLYVLFPGADALDVAHVAEQAEHVTALELAAERRPAPPPPPPSSAPAPASSPTNRGEQGSLEEEKCQQYQGGSPIRQVCTDSREQVQQLRQGGGKAAPAAGSSPLTSPNVDSIVPGDPEPGRPAALRSVAPVDPPARTGSDNDPRSSATAASERQGDGDDESMAEVAHASIMDGPIGSADAGSFSPVCAGSWNIGAGMVPYGSDAGVVPCDMHADTGPSRATPEQRSVERPAADGVVAAPDVRARAEGAAPTRRAAAATAPQDPRLPVTSDGSSGCCSRSSIAGGWCGSGASGTSVEPAGVPEATGGAGRRGCASSPRGGLAPPAYLLLVIDGTWRQGKEMFRAVAPRCLPPAAPGIKVALKPSDVFPLAAPLNQPAGSQPNDAAATQHNSEARTASTTAAAASRDASIAVTCGDTRPPHKPPGALCDRSSLEVGNSGEALLYDPEMPCLMRKEPVAGFVTTYEATTRAVGLLERDPGLATQLLAPLRLMTRLQASFSPAILSRMRTELEPAARRKPSEAP